VSKNQTFVCFVLSFVHQSAALSSFTQSNIINPLEQVAKNPMVPEAELGNLPTIDSNLSQQ